MPNVEVYHTKMQLKPLKVLIVEDELLLCNNLARLLKEQTIFKIDVVDFALNTIDAEALIEKHNPDLVFFDIELPGENALEYLAKRKHVNFEIVFVTAYAHYAIKALRLNALDYLLKPLVQAEFEEMLLRVTQRFSNTNNSNGIGKMQIDKAVVDTRPNVVIDKIIIKFNNNLDVVYLKDILYLEANRSYTMVHYLDHNKKIEKMVSVGLAEYENVLKDFSFFRIHKSYLVNVKYINSVNYTENVLSIHNNILPIGRRRVSGLKAYLLSI